MGNVVTKGYIIKYADETYRGHKNWRPKYAGYAQIYKRITEAQKTARRGGGQVIEVTLEEHNTVS